MNLIERLFGSNKIRVTFIDNSSGKEFGQSSMALEQLPEDFSIQTTMHLNGIDWTVEEATPSHISDFSQTKRLTLKLRKVEKTDLSDLLFTLPTISNELPETSDNSDYNDFETSITEDDWRQCEFLSRDSMPLVEIEFMKIKEIWASESKKVDENFSAFKNCHVRSSIGEPRLSILITELQTLLGTSDIGSLKINGDFVSNGFSLRTVNTTFYGIIIDDKIELLSVYKWNDKSIDEFTGIINNFDVLLVNWYNTQLIDQDD